MVISSERREGGQNECFLEKGGVPVSCELGRKYNPREDIMIRR